MIIAKLQGGHSNQLFQYAVARRLAIERRTTVGLDIDWFKDVPQVDSIREYELGCYPLEAKIVNPKKLSIVDPRHPHSRKDVLFKKVRLSKKIWVHHEEGQGFHQDFLRIPDNTMMVGFWQSEKYFSDIRDILIKELEPTTPLTEKNKAYLKDITSHDSIAIHVRRGDYVTNKNANAFHGILPISYYKKGVEYISKKLRKKDLKIFVFSNDISWCKKNISFDIPVVYVEGNTHGSDDMRLMKHCKHFVMANSTFSWWGAWLATNEDKIVVAPKKWFQDKAADNAIDIVPDNWVRL